MLNTNKEKILNAIRFTEIYKSYEDKYIREAKCVEFQIESILVPLDDNDIIAGMMKHNFVGFSSQYGGTYTYFFHDRAFMNTFEGIMDELDVDSIKKAHMIYEYWKLENTNKKLNNRFIEKFGYEPGHSYMHHGIANCDCRVAGTNVDFKKLISLGLGGLEKEIKNYIVVNGGSTFYTSLLLWIDILRKACEYYRVQAQKMAERAEGERREELSLLSKALLNIQNNKPESFIEGLQLMWIYSVCSDLMNYGRMDDYLGDLYAADLENGIIDEEKAVKYILGLYKHFKTIGKVHDCRVIIGGKGRSNEKNADKLAMVIMEASRRFKETVPQLTLRYYNGMSDEVLNKGLQVNAEGCSFPIIYSDETNIPAVIKAYKVSENEAEQYVPFGCGEYVLVGMSVGTPNNGVNMLKALEVTLHNGLDKFFNVQVGEKTGSTEDFDTYEKLYDAMMQQLERVTYHMAYHKMLNYKVAAENSGYLHLSLLMDDCIKRGKALLEGGVRYLNASSEVFGIISCADSLTAIKKLVYEDKMFTLKQVVDMLDKNFEGFEKERKLLLNAPKYGNDNDYADEIARRLFDDIADMTIRQGERVGLNKYNIVSVNNSMSADWGYYCEASACGRKKSAAMANANGASIGADKNGITALLNSMAKFNNEKHVGVINNIRFTKEMFNTSFDKIKMLLKTFYDNGGVQTNICAVGKDDLQNAMREPEKYRNLIVRIGGFSARFVELEPVIQREIIERTTYEG